MLKPGDVVVYTNPIYPAGHGSLAIIQMVDGHRVSVKWVLDYVNARTEAGFEQACFEKIGHLDV